MDISAEKQATKSFENSVGRFFSSLDEEAPAAASSSKPKVGRPKLPAIADDVAQDPSGPPLSSANGTAALMVLERVVLEDKGSQARVASEYPYSPSVGAIAMSPPSAEPRNEGLPHDNFQEADSSTLTTTTDAEEPSAAEEFPVSAEIVDESLHVARAREQVLSEAVSAEVMDPGELNRDKIRLQLFRRKMAIVFFLVIVVVVVGGIFLGRNSTRDNANSKETLPESCVLDNAELRSAVLKHANGTDTKIRDICVDGVTDFTSLFEDMRSFDEPLAGWNTSSVTSMVSMFERAHSFNRPLEFDSSSVTDMHNMFHEARSFNQSLNLDTSKVTSMIMMFELAESFNQPLNFSDTSSVVFMGEMFEEAISFNQPLNFDTSSVTHMNEMFEEALAFNQPLDFDTSSVEDMSLMFGSAKSFNQDISHWDVSSVHEASFMFLRASSFNQNLCSWGAKMPKDADVLGMFISSGCPTEDDPDLNADPPGPFCHYCNGSATHP